MPQIPDKGPKTRAPSDGGAPGDSPAPARHARRGRECVPGPFSTQARRARAPRPTVGDQGDEDTDKAKKGAKFILAVVAVYMLFLVVSGQMGTFVEAMRDVDANWVVAACACFGLYFVFGVGAYVVAVWLDPDSPVGIRDLMSVEASGVFFGNLTPMMAGSIPAQIYRLTRTGLDAGEAMATQFTRFIVFQFGVVLFAAIMLLAKFQFFLDTYGDIVFLNLLVFGLHTLELVGLFVVCLCPNFVMRVGNWAIKWLSRRGWLKDYARWYDVVNNQVAEFSDAFKRAASHLPSMLITLGVTMMQLACLYTIPWLVLNAFGRQGDFLACLAAGSMVQMVSSAVPLPGGTGGAEGGFALFYGPMFGSASTAGYLVWRVVTFIGPTVLAVPLLGIRSSHRESIYQRWNSLVHGTRRRAAAYDVRRARRSAVRAAKSARRTATSAGRGAARLGRDLSRGSGRRRPPSGPASPSSHGGRPS